jgi:hypothetical protein
MKDDDKSLASGAAKFLDDLGHHIEAVAIRNMLEGSSTVENESGENDAGFYEQKFNDLAFKYLQLRNKTREPRFIQFTRTGHEVEHSKFYVRLDQIQGVTSTKVYTLDGGFYSDVKDAIETFEKALKEE